jgi:hypothetical protein
MPGGAWVRSAECLRGPKVHFLFGLLLKPHGCEGLTLFGEVGGMFSSPVEGGLFDLEVVGVSGAG